MKKIGISFLSCVFIMTLTLNCFAQFDDNEIPPPPPPPGASGSGFGGGGGGRASDSEGTTSSGASGTSKILSKEKRDKLAQASVDEITDKNFPELIDSFDYNNAELTDVIKAIGELTGKNFIIDPGVRGKITIIAPTKITVAEAYKAFLSALAINGFTVVPSGGFYKIKNSRAAQRDNIETYNGSYFPNSDQMITRIIHLKHISAEQVFRELRILQSKEGEVTPFNSTNSLIISDYGSNMDRIVKILNQLDVKGFEEKLFVLKIRYAKAKDMGELINKIVNKDTSPRGSSGGGSFSAGVPRFGGASPMGRPAQGSGTAYFMVIPDERTNSLIIVGNNSGIERVKKLVEQLDFKFKADESGGVNVYYVKYGDAEKIAQTLSGIAKDSKTPTTSSGGLGGSSTNPFAPPVPQASSIFGGDVKVTADKETNSLVITAVKQDYEVVLNLLNKIDRPRNQVYVEAVILEMIINDSLTWNLGYFKFDKDSNGVGRMGFNGNVSMTDVLNPLAGTGSIISWGKDSFYPKLATGQSQQPLPSLAAFLNFLKANTKTNVLSTPQILAVENEDSTIEVGEEVAVGMATTSSAAAGATQTTAPQFKDATIMLKIKPFISPATDNIRMKIEQKIAQPEPQAQGQIPGTVTISKRSINTNIVVPDGDTAVLGGLVKDSELETVSKIPLLGDIPILGWLFKSRKMEKKKTNLIVFLTPKIVRNRLDHHSLVDKKLDERLSMIKQSGGRDPYGRKIEQFPRQAANSKYDNNESSVPPITEPEAESLEPSEPPSESDPLLNESNDSLNKQENPYKREEKTDSPTINLSPEEKDGRVVE